MRSLSPLGLPVTLQQTHHPSFPPHWDAVLQAQLTRATASPGAAIYGPNLPVLKGLVSPAAEGSKTQASDLVQGLAYQCTCCKGVLIWDNPMRAQAPTAGPGVCSILEK